MIRDKVLLHVALPVANVEYDAYIPRSLGVYELRRALGTMFAELSNGCYRFSEHTVLWNVQTGCALNTGMTVRSSGLSSGDKLLII